MASLFVSNDTVYFSASYGKNDELFAYTFPDKKLWLIAACNREGVGKYEPSVNNKNIAWSTFTAEGYRLDQTPKNELQFKEISPEYPDKNTPSFGITALQKTNSNLLY